MTNRRWLGAFVVAVCAVTHAALTPPKHDAIVAIQGLISRRLGDAYLAQIEIGVLPTFKAGLDVAHVSTRGGKVLLEGSSATAIAYGLQTYLREVVHTSTDWEDHALHLPAALPLPATPIRLQKQSPYTYYQNVCTVSYSQWAWSWAKWEKHLDWMALQGINMPLAFTGQEKVWQATFAQFNVTDLTDFFAGAAFLAWGRMGNIQGSWVRGPLPQSFIDDQFALQQKILARMEAFGMMAALPAFAGHIPTKLVELHPTAKVVRSDAWAGFRAPFTEVYLLDPTDPLFVQLGAAFLRTYQDMYKYTAHVYQTDTYNEMDPRLASAAYLGASSAAVLCSMQAVDKDAVWLMQGWLFSFSRFWTLPRIEHYLKPLPFESLIVLDLYAEVSPVWEKTTEFFNHQWIYCVLHNFGGSLGMRGDLETIATAPVVARTATRSMVGVGLTMEGIFQNYVVYDLSLHMAWAPTRVNVSQYVHDFALARYLRADDAALAAWSALQSSVYDVRKAYGGVTKNIVCLRPRWRLVQSAFMPTKLSHDPKQVQLAWQLLLAAAVATPALAHDDAFTHDLVDVTRQAMSDGILATYEEIESMADQGDATLAQVTAITGDLLERMTDLDAALSSHADFMLGPWIADARALARDAATAAYFEYEARNQITRWGDNNYNALTDYAAKEWGGLVSSYYVPRWRLWVQELRRSWAAKDEMDVAAVVAKVEAFELEWQVDTTTVFPTTAQRDPVQVSIELYEKYVGKVERPRKDAQFVEKADSSAQRHRLDYTPLCILDCLW